MATFSYTNAFTAGSPAVATQVNTNFNDVKTFAIGIASGTNLDTNAVTGPKIATNAVSVSKLDSTVLNLLPPIASVMQFMGTAEPTGWKFCNGQTLVQANYPDLYSLLTSGGTVFRYGPNPTGSTFVLPNMQHRVPVGLGSEAEFDTLGEVGGAKTHTLTGPQSGLPAHTVLQNEHTHTGGLHQHGGTTGVTDIIHSHNQVTQKTTSSSHTHNVNGSTAAGMSSPTDTSSDGTATDNPVHSHAFTTNNGGDVATAGTIATNIAVAAATAAEAHNNLQPYMTVNYIIRVA